MRLSPHPTPSLTAYQTILSARILRVLPFKFSRFSLSSSKVDSSSVHPCCKWGQATAGRTCSLICRHTIPTRALGQTSRAKRKGLGCSRVQQPGSRAPRKCLSWVAVVVGRTMETLVARYPSTFIRFYFAAEH